MLACAIMIQLAFGAEEMKMPRFFGGIGGRGTIGSGSTGTFRRARSRRERLLQSRGRGGRRKGIRNSALDLGGVGRGFSQGASSLAQQFQDALNAANKANEDRFQQLLSEVEGSGAQERTDINATFDRVAAGNMQDLVSRGLRTGSVATSSNTGVARQRTDALGRLEDRLRQQRLGIIERREDTGPDLGQLIALSQGLGRAGGSLGGAGFGGGFRFGGAPFGQGGAGLAQLLFGGGGGFGGRRRNNNNFIRNQRRKRGQVRRRKLADIANQQRMFDEVNNFEL